MEATKRTSNRQSIWLIRILGIVTAAIVPPFRFVLPAEAYDPMWMRLSISGVVLAIVLVSFLYQNLERHARLISNAVAFAITGWMLYLAVANGLAQEYTTSYFIMLFASIILFKDRYWLLAFILFHVASVVSTVFWIADPSFEPVTFVSMVVSIMGIGSLGQWTGVLEYQQSQKIGARLGTLNQTALATSNEGIIVTDHLGQIQRGNANFESLFEIAIPKEGVIPMQQWLQGLQRLMMAPEIALRFSRCITESPENEIVEHFQLLNGRHVRLHSKPIPAGNSFDGRIWFFKDVTKSILEREAMLQQRDRLRRQNEMLLALSTDTALLAGEMNVMAPIVVTETSHSLLADRASIWQWDPQTEVLTCTSQYDAKTGVFVPSPSFSKAAYPAYFKAIAAARIFMVEDAYRDPITAALYKDDPKLPNPLRLLEVPLRLGGRLYGILSIERSTGDKAWTVEDQQFLAAIGDLLVMSIEARERCHAEEQLAKSAALLKAVFESAGVAILVTRIDRSVIDCNETYLQLFGMTREFLFASPPEEVIAYCQSLMSEHSEIRKSMQFLKDHPNENHSRTIYFKDGRIVERDTEVLRVDQEVIGRVWFYRDVTEAAVAEQDLRNSELRNEAIVKAIPDLMLRLSDKAEILDLKIPENWALNSLILDVHAQHLSDLFTPELADEIRETIAIALREQQVLEQERTIDMMGTVRDYETRIAPSGPAEVLIMLRDVTERKKTEKELVQRNHELDSFVYRASHDLKAPLNSVMGIIDIIKAESKDPNLETYLKLMDRSVVKLDTFVRNLADFTRVNRLALQNHAVNFESLIAEVNDGLKHMQNAERIVQRFQIKTEAPFYGDDFHLGILLSNLLSNAIKYFDPEKAQSYVELDVRCDVHTCTITVADNGIGIAQSHQERIFELFFRASNQSFGSGIGLYITRNAVEKMGGTIMMASEEGVGTTFTITLPNRSPEVQAS